MLHVNIDSCVCCFGEEVKSVCQSKPEADLKMLGVLQYKKSNLYSWPMHIYKYRKYIYSEN